MFMLVGELVAALDVSQTAKVYVNGSLVLIKYADDRTLVGIGDWDAVKDLEVNTITFSTGLLNIEAE